MSDVLVIALAALGPLIVASVITWGLVHHEPGEDLTIGLLVRYVVTFLFVLAVGVTVFFLVVA